MSEIQIERVGIDELEVEGEEVFREGVPFTGIAFELFGNGRVSEEWSYVDGIRQGVSRAWYRNGVLEEEVSYWRGGMHGLARCWNQEGALVWEKLFKYGLLVSERRWSPEGALVSRWEAKEDDSVFELIEKLRKERGEYPSV